DEVKGAFEAVARARAEAETAVEKAREDAQQRWSKAQVAIRQEEERTKAYVAGRAEQARAEAAYFEARLEAYRANPLVRQAGRWGHLLQMVRRLAASGQIQPLDPAIDLSFPGLPRKD